MCNSNDELGLVQRARAGDRTALERLLLDHYEPLKERVSLRLPESIQAIAGVEDVVQLTFAKAFQSIEDYELRDDATFLSWLTCIAENQVRDVVRTQARKKRGGEFRRLGVFRCEDGERTAELIDQLAGDDHTPSQSLARREGIRTIQIALAGLPEEYRTAVQLHYFDGYSLEETAARMGRTPGSVRGLLQRAKKKMSEALVRASLYLSTN